MGASGKVCVICGEDCSGRPRIKDGSGRYACKACAAARRGATARPTPAPVPAPDGDDGLMALDPLDPLEPVGDAVGGDLGEDDLAALESMGAEVGAGPVEGRSCENCGSAAMPDAVICLQCGSSLTGGKRLKTKVSRGGPDRSDLGEVAAKTALASKVFVSWILAGLSAAALGGAGWALISIQTGYEIRIVALAIGALCGGAVVLATRGGYLGVQSGAIAAVCALLGMLGGKFATNYHFIHQVLPEIEQMAAEFEHWPTEDDCQREIAVGIVLEMEDAGQTVRWAAHGMTVDTAFWPTDYPGDVRAEVRETWGAKSPEEREAFRSEIVDEACLQVLVDEIAQERIRGGEEIDWPEDGMSIEYAVWPLDYPEELERETRARWARFPEWEREQYRNELYADIQGFEFSEADVREVAAVTAITDFHWRYIIWFPVSLFVAFGIGARGGEFFGS